MFRANRPTLICLVAVLAAVGCGQLGIIYDKTGDAHSATATIDITVTDTDTNDVLATATLSASEPSAHYAVEAISSDMTKLCLTRNLKVEATYNDNAASGNTATDLDPLSFALQVLHKKFIVIENSTGTPTMTLENRNTTGVKLDHVPVLID